MAAVALCRRCAGPITSPMAATRSADVAGVEGVEHQIDAGVLVLAVELREAVVVTDERAAPNAVDLPDARVVARE